MIVIHLKLEKQTPTKIIITFILELPVGLDYGGLSREFFDLLSVELFDVSNKLFMRFNEEDHQGLVSHNII